MSSPSASQTTRLRTRPPFGERPRRGEKILTNGLGMGCFGGNDRKERHVW